MRCFDFKAKNIGDSERYLTYVMGEGVELDEDTLDILEDGDIPGLVKVIYEEDDDFDYLTYDVSGMTNLAAFTEGEVDKETVLKVVRNISLSIISLKERAIHLAYLVLNKGFMFVDKRTLDVTFLCVPDESEAFVMKEFKSFLKYFIAGLKFNIGEDVSYVGQILTYVNGDAFNLRGLIGLTEALMQDAGISFEESDEAISNGKFDIKPTMVKNKHDACEYCHFHDVCYINKNKIIYENLSKNNMKADVDDDDFDDEEGDDSDED